MNLTECPVCSSSTFKDVLKARDHLVSKELFTIVECPNCTLRFTNPRPENNELSGYYESEEYISHTNEGNSLINRLYKLARQFTLRSKRQLLQKNLKEKTLLDIGCGTGHFLSHCINNGWEGFGVEPDPKAREIAIEQTGAKVLANLEDVKEKQFDRISLWHVLEHLPALEESILQIAALLKDDGKLFIAVPNYLAKEARKYEEYWAAYDVPRHLYHFTPKSIQKLTEQNGLIIEKVHPMWLDSFYISLLSNKNKFGSNKMLNSFITGLLSNIYGVRTGNFSSLIYQISKSR